MINPTPAEKLDNLLKPLRKHSISIAFEMELDKTKQALAEFIEEEVGKTIPTPIAVGSKVYHPDGSYTHYTGPDAVNGYNAAIDEQWQGLQELVKELRS